MKNILAVPRASVSCRGDLAGAKTDMKTDNFGLNPPPSFTGIERSREHLSTLFARLVNNSSDIITVTGADGRFRFISASLTEVLGWRPDELIGQESFPFIHPEDLAGALAAFEQVVANPDRLVTHRYRLRHQDGHYVPIEGRATNLLADPFVQGILINSRDISHRIEEEEALLRTRTTLEREVESRTAEIRAANILLQREIEDRRQAEEHLRQRLAEAVALEHISRVFMTAERPDFQAVLRLLGETMRVSRAFLHLLREGMIIQASFEWCLRAEDAQVAFAEGTRISQFSWAFERLSRNELVSIPDVRELPPEARATRALCREMHAHAFLLVPILAKNGSLWGVLGIDHTDRPHRWSPEEERFIRVVSEIIVHSDTARRAEQALRESEIRFRTVFEHAAMSMVVGGPNGELLACNKIFEAMLGYSQDEMQGRHFQDFTHPEDRSRSLSVYGTAESGERDWYQIQKRYIRKDGQPVWANTTVSTVRDAEGELLYTIGMIEDISREMETRHQLLAYQEQLRTLASQLSLVEEQQRRRIAAELHDRIGQTLAMVKIKLGECREVAESAGLIEQFFEINDLLDQIISDTRSLIFEISPPVLYELGFEAAVEWLTEQFRDRHGLQVVFHDDRKPKPMEDDVRILLFQAVRELLVNIVKHASASRAQVALRREDGWIRVTISDDGIGFDLSQVRLRMGRQGGFGLFNIQERLASIGGSMDVETPDGGGARIVLRAPLRILEREARRSR
jgi:PAS domain S-box-containing protein